MQCARTDLGLEQREFLSECQTFNEIDCRRFEKVWKPSLFSVFTKTSNK